jgi:polyphosphate kinase
LRGISDRIRVRSIVGRFLEHSRIFYFENGGDGEIYLGSADWMPRNLYERVEVVFPVLNAMLRQRVLHEILEVYLADRVKARFLLPDGSYVHAWELKGRRRRATETSNVLGAGEMTGMNAQEFLMGLAEGRQIATKAGRQRAAKGAQRVRG